MTEGRKLLAAASSGSVEAARSLLAAAGDAGQLVKDSKDPSGERMVLFLTDRTALNSTVCRSLQLPPKLLWLLVGAPRPQGSPARAPDLAGCTPLHLAAAGGHESVVEALLEHVQADEELLARDSGGAVPLHEAAQVRCAGALPRPC